MKLMEIYRRLHESENTIDLPEYIYHVTPYTRLVMRSGKLVPGGMGSGDDFGGGFGGGITHGISFFTDIEKSKDYANGMLLAIMLSKSVDVDDAVRIFNDWASIQERRLGVDLSSIREYFKYELDRYFDIGGDILKSLKSVRQLVSIKASRIDKRLDDPIIYGALTKFKKIDTSDLSIITVQSSQIPHDAVVKRGTDPDEIRIEGVEIPIYNSVGIVVEKV